MKASLDVVIQKSLCVLEVISVMVIVGFVLEPSTQSTGFFIVFDTAYVLYYFQLMVYLASISKPPHTYIPVCVYFFFSIEKRNSKEHSSAMDTWRQGNCSKGRSSNARLDSETQI